METFINFKIVSEKDIEKKMELESIIQERVTVVQGKKEQGT